MAAKFISAAKLIKRPRSRRSFVSLPASPPARDVCLELHDHSELRRSAVEFFRLKNSRDPLPQAARMAESFEQQNRSLLSVFNVKVTHVFDGNDVALCVRAGSFVGAVPLLSPTTAAPDYGLVVQPRFPWVGIGPMLAQMGWRIAPIPLKLPLLRRSERRVPPWVMSSMVLTRIEALLDSLNRRFEMARETVTAPRGQVHWSEYATRYAANAQFLSIPCSFPELRDDRLLKGAIRYSLERHLQSLGSQREHGAFVHRLIDLCQRLMQRVQGVVSYIPNPTVMGAWLQRPLRAQHFADGIEAIGWTVDDRGLAGLSDLEGIPWTMPMDQFFEAWTETVFERVARHTGARLKVGRKRETTRAISWDPTFTGSQKSLIPDIWLEWPNLTLIVDAKYKRHWEELQLRSWSAVEDELKEQHRNDLMQVLAYAALAQTPNVIACLAYPCSAESWSHLKNSGRLIHKAEISIGARTVRLWLTAIPMATNLEQIAAVFIKELQTISSP